MFLSKDSNIALSIFNQNIDYYQFNLYKFFFKTNLFIKTIKKVNIII